MKQLLTILCILLLGSSVAQQDTIPVFDYTVSTAHGDLNKDGILDFVIVTQDTASNFGPYRLEIFFTLANGDKKLIVQTDKAIEKQYQNGKSFSGFTGFGASKLLLLGSRFCGGFTPSTSFLVVKKVNSVT